MYILSIRCLLLLLQAGGTLSLPASHSPKRPKHAAVVSESSLCSELGLDIIRKYSGNAIDALITTVFCVGVVGCFHSGPGGGGFGLIRASSGNYTLLDFRETAPAAATENMFANVTGSPSLYSGKAVGVPGELRGLEAMWKRWGSVPWRELVEPARKLADEGFVISGDLAKAMNASGAEYLVNDKDWAIDFAPRGKVLQEGDVMTRKRYASFLEKVKQRGASALYEGLVAQEIVRSLRKKDGIMTLADLSDYRVLERTPLQVPYRKWKLTGGGAPSSGGIVLLALKIFEGFVRNNVPKARGIHQLVESTKFAHGARSEFGDPSYTPNVTDFQQHLLKDSVTSALRLQILPDSVLPNISFYNPLGYAPLDTAGTSQVSVLDSNGFAASLTTTINTWFGSRIVTPDSGIILNNEMDDFSVPGKTNFFGYLPSPANFIRPGKRPLSSISNVIVEDVKTRKPYFVIGAAGGSRITTATIQNINGVLDEGLTARQALKAPRWHDQLSPNTTTFEYAYDNSTIAKLKQMGHIPTWVAPGLSSAQGIIWQKGEGRMEAAGEPRQVASGGAAF